MKRKDVNPKYFWKVEDIFQSTEAWEKGLKELDKGLDFSKFKGKLNDKKVLKECFVYQDKLSRLLEKVYCYASMLRDQDTSNADADALVSKAQGVYVKFMTETSFITPELTSLDAKYLDEVMADKDFSDYSYVLKQIADMKPHVLSEEAEKILALGGEVNSSFRDIFTKVDNADLPFATIKDSDGKKIKLSHGTYGVCMQNHDREVRRKAFKAYYKSYIGLINTITATYYGSVKKDVYISRARKYKSCLDMALLGEDVKPIVYKNLISAVEKGLPYMHDYIAEKKKILGVDTMHMYDISVPIAENVDLQLEYEDAYALVKEGLAPLGKEYSDLLQQAFDERWIDVYETEGKRSGAYSTGMFDVHPFVLLNYQKTTHDVFTIAHEMGHSIHTYYSNKTQPYAKADYRIFVAEVASTVNEVLLLKHILKNATDKNLKKYLLSYFLEMIRTTCFRQTQFAEFEYQAHNMVEKGKPLTKEILCKTYHKLNKKYYGKAVLSDKEISYEWSRIPHFYNAFYVYKYATGIISAIKIADRILTEGQPAVDDYFKFLSSGSSNDPVSLLKIAGVDLTDTKVFEDAMNVFKNTLEELKAL